MGFKEKYKEAERAEQIRRSNTKLGSARKIADHYDSNSSWEWLDTRAPWARWYLNNYHESSRQRRSDAGQVDLSMMNPEMLASVMSTQHNRRRGFSGTILTGALGLDDDETRRKTLLGS